LITTENTKFTEIKGFLHVLCALRGETLWQAHQIGTPLVEKRLQYKTKCHSERTAGRERPPELSLQVELRGRLFPTFRVA
jgi:hypothetical protein